MGACASTPGSAQTTTLGVGGSRQMPTSRASPRARIATASLVVLAPGRLRDPFELVDQDEGLLARELPDAAATARRNASAQELLRSCLEARFRSWWKGDPGPEAAWAASVARRRTAATVIRARASSQRFLELVCLVEDDGVVLGQDARAVAAFAQREVGEVEGVVGDHQVGLGRALPSALRETRCHARAAPAEAAVRADRDSLHSAVLGSSSSSAVAVAVDPIHGSIRL